ncbi:uncharacterized protein An09g05390 [Aspergillus niger]|uniref:Contig An09c0170, genomic contig n=2 Tax=Aspergillus niger TaxID=5061 RepID=A2QUE7_ASPNC|nr:uncharacterized protein An09g05390 [Aspergillus niger]CAL00816.1 unnamed protein product [Aspergillus niger]
MEHCEWVIEGAAPLGVLSSEADYLSVATGLAVLGHF